MTSISVGAHAIPRKQPYSSQLFQPGTTAGLERSERARSARRAKRSRHSANYVSGPGQELARDIDAHLPRDADVRETRRHMRYAQRELLWGVSTLKRVRECGRVPCAPKGQSADTVTIRDNAGIAHFSGLATCGSTWACTVCEPKIASARAEEISSAAAAWDRAGNSVFMVTLTVSHHQGLQLAPLMGGIADAFRFLIGGRPWKTLKTELGIAGTIRSMEITWGRNGWHPHLHVLVFLAGDPGARGLFLLNEHFQRRWKAAARNYGLGAPDDAHGVKVERCTSAAEAGAYIAKTSGGKSAGNELARGDLKTGRKGHRTPFQMLEDFRQTGDKDDLDRWQQYERATKGRRKITWSRGLHDLLAALAALGAVKSDEELAAAEIGGTDVITIDVIAWRKIVRVPGLPAQLLHAAEQGGQAAVVAAAARYSIRLIDRGRASP